MHSCNSESRKTRAEVHYNYGTQLEVGISVAWATKQKVFRMKRLRSGLVLQEVGCAVITGVSGDFSRFIHDTDSS